MGGLRAEELLRRPVRFRDIELGRPVDVILALDARRAVGFELVCGDDERRFLPLAAATVDADAIRVRSPLVLLEEDELGFYRTEARTLRALRGTTVEREGRPTGVLRDVVFAADGAIEELVLEEDGGSRQAPLDGLVLSGQDPR